jgi:NitT/TauT family transport system substrate-binding protein
MGTGLQKFITVALVFAAALFSQAQETIRIGIETQDTTINCAAGGAVIRELNLLDKFLPHTGRYKDVHYDIVWRNFTTGATLGNEMFANRLDIGQMADFPGVLTADSFAHAHNGVRLLYVANLEGSIKGAGNAIVVPVDSPIQSVRELRGKRISVPFGSTSHAMLLRAIQNQGWDPNTDVEITTQAPEVGGSALRSHQIDAHADFVPFGELFPFRGFARKILDGISTGVTTTHGVVVRSDFAEKYPELVVAYLRAALEADRLLRQDPEGMSENLQKWTGIDAEVVYAFHGPGGIQTRDFTLKPEFRDALVYAADTLKILKKVDPSFDPSTFAEDKYIREAFRQTGLDYDAALHNYSPLPITGTDYVTRKPIGNINSVGQIWVRGESKLRLYGSPAATLTALRNLEASNTSVRVAFLHDHDTGLKLFAKFAWYVQDRSDVTAFLLKDSAEEYARKHGGAVVAFSQAKEDAPTKVAKFGSVHSDGNGQ